MRARRPHHHDDEAAATAAPEQASKSQRKREMQALQTLGEALAELPRERLAAVAMPEALREAIAEYQRTRSHEGRRRQMQYVGKLMRRADAEPLHDAVAAFRLGSARDALLLHEAERWRAELVAADAALQRWAQAHPASDLPRLRSLVQAARVEHRAPEQRHGRSWRALYQFIKPHLSEGG